MSAPKAPNVSNTYSKEMQAYNQYLPSILQTQNEAIGPAAQATLAATQQTQPGYNALNLQQLQQYGLPTAQVNQQITNSNAQAGAATNLQQIQGAGGRAATAAQSLTNSLNPALASANSRAVDGLNAINLNGLSAGEQNSVERSLNQNNYATGNLGINNATNTVSNAMNFGGAFNSKLGLLNNAIGTATGAANASTNAINPTGVALSQPNQSTSNFGTGSSANTLSGTAGNINGAGTSFLSGLNSTGAANLGNQFNASNYGAVVGSNGMLSDIGRNASSCFITTVCCENMGLADDCETLTVLRKFRDAYVPRFLVEEYYKLQPTLEPKLRVNRPLMDRIYYKLLQCVDDIKNGRNESALNRYTNMVENLKEI